MPSESIELASAAVATVRDEAFAKLHATIKDEYAGLHRQVAVLVQRLPGRRTRVEVDELAGEALGEAVRRVLDSPGNFDPARSAFPWIVAVALRVVGEGARVSGPRSRRVGLDPGAWNAIEDPRGAADEARASDRIDLSRTLALLEPPDRLALECHYIQGLTNEALAEALGMATPSGARSRVYRAMQKARKLARGEVNP